MDYALDFVETFVNPCIVVQHAAEFYTYIKHNVDRMKITGSRMNF